MNRSGHPSTSAEARFPSTGAHVSSVLATANAHHRAHSVPRGSHPEGTADCLFIEYASPGSERSIADGSTGTHSQRLATKNNGDAGQGKPACSSASSVGQFNARRRIVQLRPFPNLPANYRMSRTQSSQRPSHTLASPYASIATTIQ